MTTAAAPIRSLEASAASLRGKRAVVVLFAPYPADARPRRAAEALVSQGMRVEVVCIRERPEEPRREVFNGVEILRIPIRQRRGGVLEYLFEYASFIAIASVILAYRSFKRRLDLVHVHNMPDILILSALLPRVLGARVILDLHDPMPELMTCIFGLSPTSIAVRLMRLLERWSIARADIVLTTNIAFRRLFASRTPQADKLHIVMNSPDEAMFTYCQFVPGKRTPFRPFVVMYHGTILERHGLDLAVEAVSMARTLIPQIELQIYGPPTAFLDRVMTLARERGWHAAIRYVGVKPLEAIVTAIDACDVGIIPNRRSPFTDINMPTRIFEFLSRGRAVIAPRTPGVLDYFDDEELLFFKPGDAADLARAIIDSYRHPDAVARVVERGQQVYLANRWDGERARLVSLVRGLLVDADHSTNNA